TEPREFRFPYDHGAHPAYRNEWWYVTGNFEDQAGRRYGMQLTLFRIALAPEREGQRPSAWATNQAWMGHLALTDVAGDRFHHAERFARGGELGLAGTQRDPVRVWLEDWRLERVPSGAWRLRAGTDEFGVELTLDPQKAPVLQGEDGLSQKSAESGNASYYYSLTRLAAEGSVRLKNAERSVTGSAWLDREWSTSALGPEQAGWDWFALQLDDGTDVMIYHLRREDGAPSRFSAGVVVGPEGDPHHLGPGDFEIEVLDRWRAPDGPEYPSRWRVEVPGVDGPLMVVPVRADQELQVSVRYWEGAVDVLRGDEPVGRGYVELTGYE
ncbi:MAG: lipocalin-like domain-containing protein, partial [Halofilum sp. (in: g-proteobacteria)]